MKHQIDQKDTFPGIQPNHWSSSLDTIRNLGRNVLILSGAVLAAGALAGSSHAAAHEGAEPKATHSRSYEAAPALPQSKSFEATSDQVVASVETQHGAAIINGKPTFLFGVWAPKDDWAVNTLGVNTLIANSSGDITQEQLAKSVEGRAWVLRDSQPNTSAFARTFPNEIGVALRDEPDSPITPTTPSEIAKSPQDGRLVFENFTQHIGDILINGATDPTAPSPQTYKAYIANLGNKAAVSFDYYPLNRDSCRSAAGASIGALYHYTLGEKMAVPTGTLIAGYVETGRIDSKSCSVDIAPADVTGEAKAEITGGAGMINWWTYSWLNQKGEPDPNSVTNDKVAQAVKNFSADVHRLSPILLAPQMDERKLGLASDWKDPIKIGGRVVTNPDGSKTNYIIAFNSSKQPISTTQIKQKLPGLTNQNVREAVSGDVLKANDGKIDTMIAPEDWVILGYNLPSSQAQVVSLKSGKVVTNQSAAKTALQAIKPLRTESTQKPTVIERAGQYKSVVRPPK